MDLGPKQGDLGRIKVRRPRIERLPYSFRRQGLYLLWKRGFEAYWNLLFFD